MWIIAALGAFVSLSTQLQIAGLLLDLIGVWLIFFEVFSQILLQNRTDDYFAARRRVLREWRDRFFHSQSDDVGLQIETFAKYLKRLEEVEDELANEASSTTWKDIKRALLGFLLLHLGVGCQIAGIVFMDTP